MRLPAFQAHQRERQADQAAVRALWINALGWCVAIATCCALSLFVP